MKTKKYILPFAFFLLGMGQIQAQSTYTSANFAAAGDTVYLTKATLTAQNFDTTGTNISWDYTNLSGNSQRDLIFRTPSQSGVAWAYVLNPANANLSSTDNYTISTAAIQYTDPNDFYYKNNSGLAQVGSSSKIIVGGIPITLKNQYSADDQLIQFPLDFGDEDSSDIAYTTSYSTLYYKETTLKRHNEVVGWGSLSTPYGTFANCLKMETYLIQTDTIAVDTFATPKITTYYREFNWFDPVKKYPLLTVKQILTGSTYVTQSIEFLDNKTYFQPISLFAYLPLTPLVDDTVNFQNLSQNASSFAWDFGDPGSGALNTSTVINPYHVYSNPGDYTVTLITYNGPLSDTIQLPVSVFTVPNASFSFAPQPVYESDTVFFTNESVNGTYYQWIFDDAASGNADTSYLDNPKHVYQTAGIYSVQLIAYSPAGSDTVLMDVTILAPTIPTAGFSFSPLAVFENDVVTFTNTSSNALTYEWNFGDPASGSNNSSQLDNPTHSFQTAGIYTVTLIATSSFGSDTLTTDVTVNPAQTGSLKEVNSNPILVYPNPAQDRLFIKNPMGSPYEMQLTDLQGKVIASQWIPVSDTLLELSLKDFESGIYLLQISGENQHFVQKIHIQR